jgi:hypothetical protein
MIKNLIILGLVVVVGVLTYPTLKPYLDSYLKKDEATVSVATTTTPTVVPETPAPAAPVKEVETKKAPVVIDEDGALRDGPFKITDTNDKDTGATAEIIRSPEETLLQFKNVSFTHGASVELHLAKDVKGKDYLNLGPARINSGVLVYGLPLDLDLSVFTHLMFYNPDTNVNEFVVSFK